VIQFSKPDVEQFFRTFAVQNFAVSPDEKQLIFSTNLNGKFNLWAMDLPNTFPYPLTFIDQSCDTIQYDKQGRFVIVGFDHDGDENTQLYAIPPQGGQLAPIRVKEGERHFLTSLSKDGERLYYSSTKGNQTYINSYCYHLNTEKEDLIIEGEDAATILYEVSPEEKSFVYGKVFANTYILGFVRKDEQDILITPPTDDQFTLSEAVYISENELFIITNYDSEFSYLAKFNIDTHEFSKVSSADNEEFTSMKYDKKNKLIYIISSKGVEDHLYKYDLSTHKNERLDLPVCAIEQLVLTESGSLYLLGQSSTRPSNIYQRKAA
jgi:dipeptidyl aminopeptidase/acylaminoacyl peptidase